MGKSTRKVESTGGGEVESTGIVVGYRQVHRIAIGESSGISWVEQVHRNFMGVESTGKQYC